MQVLSLSSLLRFQFLYQEGILSLNGTSLLPSLILFIETANIGLKAIVVKNAKKLNEIYTRKKNTSETQLENHCNPTEIHSRIFLLKGINATFHVSKIKKLISNDKWLWQDKFQKSLGWDFNNG